MCIRDRWYSVDSDNNETLLQSGTSNNLEISPTSEQNIKLYTTYLDGELYERTVESNNLVVKPVDIYKTIDSVRFT